LERNPLAKHLKQRCSGAPLQADVEKHLVQAQWKVGSGALPSSSLVPEFVVPTDARKDPNQTYNPLLFACSFSLFPWRKSRRQKPLLLGFLSQPGLGAFDRHYTVLCTEEHE
jgi:hypothetical protein